MSILWFCKRLDNFLQRLRGCNLFWWQVWYIYANFRPFLVRLRTMKLICDFTIFVWFVSSWCCCYSWLSLSRYRLSRIKPYLEAVIWSLLKHKNLTIGNKLLWKRGEIALRSNFSSFPQYFQYISNFRSQITYTFVKYGCSIHFFPKVCKSDMWRYGYLEVFQRVPWNSRERESTVYFFVCHSEVLLWRSIWW